MSDLSRVEQLLRNVLGEDVYEVTPQSRIEALLVELNELIEGMGGSVSPEDIATAVAAYLDEHLTNPTSPPIDASLTIAGAAADAKKTGDEIGDLKEDLQSIGNELIDVPKALTPDETDADLYISDSNGNVLAKFERGNIATKKFNSEDVPEVRDTSVQSGVFDLADTSGNVVVRFENGHIKTKEFNSAEVGSAIPSIGVKGEKALSLHNAFSNCYIYHHMHVEVSNPYIPSESLYDIRFAKSLGFDMIEANTHKCSDGVFLVKHGGNSGGLGNGLKDAIGSADYSAVKWEEVTSTWIRENVRYNARLPKYCGYIPTLDEFCKECRRFNMKVKVSSLEAAMVARKYLPDEMIWATLGIR